MMMVDVVLGSLPLWILKRFGHEAIKQQKWLGEPYLRGQPEDCVETGEVELAIKNRGRKLIIEWVGIEVEGEILDAERYEPKEIESGHTLTARFMNSYLFRAEKKPVEAFIVVKARGYPDPMRKRVPDRVLDRLELSMHRYFDHDEGGYFYSLDGFFMRHKHVD